MQYTQIVPYIMLLLAIIVARWTPIRYAVRLALVFVAAAVAAGLLSKALTPLAVIPICLLALFIWIPGQFKPNKYLTAISYGLFIILALALANHLVPGFYNLPVFINEQLSVDSAPFNMYLNLDKPLIGIFIYLFYLKSRETSSFTKNHGLTVVKVVGLLATIMIPLALMIGYVRVDIKYPELGWLWMLNNLFFVCLAEEALFRGFIQNGFTRLFPKTPFFSYASIAVAAVLFGLAHYKGGPIYVALAAVAGLFYGFAYQKTNRLDAAVLVHFGFNTIHFLLFSYPNLQSLK